ncbi:MAG TPA: protein kinase [Polyangia bacterium]|nr:protein kinase [Polyangia bacterium]
MPGPPLGRYKLSARIAQGGMGEVYRGVDVGYGGIERPVAVKLIAPALALDPSLKRQFVDEAKLSYLLCHQNVIGVRDVGEIDGRFYIAMEWIDGADLGTIVQRLRTSAGQPLPLRFACLVAVEAARGLDYAHRARDAAGQALHLVHRDVSPSNLLVSFEGEIKVSDFGIARSRLREVTSMPGGLKGKVGYMAPEQARAEPLDARADVFSLGAVMFEMLSGQNPFTFDAPKENEALERVRAGRFPSVRALLASVPQGLEAIVMRAMAPDRAERYQTCDQMREDLEVFARRESYTLSPSDFGQFVRDLMDAPGPEPERAKSATPPKRLSGTRAVAAPRAFNDALGGALASLGGSGDDEPGAADAPPVATSAVPTLPARPTVVAKPVKAHAAITPPAAAAPAPSDRPRSPTDMTDLIPRGSSRLPLLLGGAAFLAVVAAGAVLYISRAPAAAAPVATASVPIAVPAPVPAHPQPVPPTHPSPLSPAISVVVEPPPPSASRNGHHDHHARGHNAVAVAAPPPAAHPATAAATPPPAPAPAPAPASPSPPPGPPAKAHLTVTADVQSDAYIDGQYIRATPIVDYELAAGRHTIHLESAAPGLRLIPRDRTVDLKPGELKEVRMELK